MDIVFGILGSVASIVGLLLPAKNGKQRVIHLVYGVVIIVVAYFAVDYQQKYDRLVNVEKVATQMVSDQSFEYTNLGFVHAVLAFLEKNQDLYPDTYKRALNMCAQYKCDSPEGDSVDMVTLSFTFSGLLKGIATQQKDAE
ncbi:conserved hypothetical protein [Vibrio chagasii]|uniref:hypothetical protein n=1 Tax=Vibrio sp. 10N.222.55.C6 TaxID=3229649 RepID=UPI0033879F5C|nr:conserved hypothetical protein [Vibrio chagasii]CAH7311483.1 conserved hypothetical protein [Vibrio chagasii]CAH7485057.1 conserved hypothetical protein [Vibrio chagasii]